VDEALQNRFRLTGRLVWDFGKDLRWRTQEMRGLGSPPSTFKRCHFLRDLAAAYARTGSSVYAAKFAELVGRWLADWPLVVDPDFGPGDAVLSRSDGHKAMPTAFRVINWLDCLYGGVVFAPEVPVDTAFGLIRSMWFTALQYRRYETSPYVPANHHLWERGTAPFIFGIMFPEFPEIARLVDQGRPVIARHAERSFLSDGGYEERSTSYTFAPLRMFLRPLQLALLNRTPLLDRGQEAKVKRCVENTARTVMPHGAPPDIGDGSASAERAAKLLGLTARLLKSHVAADVVNRLRLQRHVDPDDREAVETYRPQKLPLTAHYPASGYFVARDGWTPRASAMSLSAPGPGLPNHAHDDALSLQLVVRGTPVVGTPMTGMYNFVQQDRYRNHAAPLRGHFHAMTSHNLVLVGGRPLRSIEDLARDWRVEPTPVQTAWEEVKGGVRVVSAHRGYPGVKLSREVVFLYRKGWRVRDRMEGGGSGPHVCRWHFEYGVDVAKGDGGFVATRREARLGIRVSAEGRARTRLYRDTRWLRKNPLRPGELAPWVLDVTFGGTGDGWVETCFEVLKK